MSPTIYFVVQTILIGKKEAIFSWECMVYYHIDKLQQKEGRLLSTVKSSSIMGLVVNNKLNLMFMKHYDPNRCLYIKVA